MKHFLCALCLFCAALSAGCDVEELGSLSDISRPYAAEYKCVKLLFGGKDLLGEFAKLVLSLDRSGGFSLAYEDRAGRKGGYRGSYEVEGDEIVFRAASGGKERSFVFSYDGGTVELRLLLGNRLLLADFSAL